ncbi:MAG: clostripain-related cysteine peptidase [Elusimicrobia bacterium]|nr:clostripain-related cysteine peptidase [Elusimicrobiota bacterium]
MKSAISLLLIVQVFFLTPALNAQFVTAVPVQAAPISAPVVGAAAASQGGTVSMVPGLQMTSLIQPGLSPVTGSLAPSLQAPAAAAPRVGAPTPAEMVRAANTILSALPGAKLAPADANAAASLAAPAAQTAAPAAQPAASSVAAAKAAKDVPASSLKSLQAAADDRQQPGRSKEAVASAMFDGTKQQAEPKEWTFMVFLNGHNNLDSYGEVNIKQMEKVGSNDRVNIVVQWASLGQPTKRMLIQRSETGEVSSPVIEELPSVDMGSADKLFEFIQWTVEKFPAAHYMVDIWDHGAGWHLKKAGRVHPMDISWDDQTGNHITTEQLGVVMRKAKDLIGRPIDVLGFDACLMAMAEVVAQVADAVHYVAGSEQTEPGAGWPYENVLKQWLAAEADDGASLLKALAEQYTAAYGRNVAFSGIDVSRLPAFVEAVKAFCKEVMALNDAKFAKVRSAASGTQRYAYDDYGDFLDFIGKVSDGSGIGVSQPVLAAVISAYKAMIVVNNTSQDLSASTGMSVWLPMSSYVWQRYGARYLGLVWNTLTDWGKFARRLSGAKAVEDASSPRPVALSALRRS